MGRERQKFKNRSSISKVRQKPKSKKKILQNPIIAANWDQKQTLAQNYKRLGLAVKLNKESGGKEKLGSDVQVEGLSKHGAKNGLTIHGSTGIDSLELSEAKVERDPKTGAILRVLPEGQSAKSNPLNDPLNDLDSGSEVEEDGVDWARLDNQHGNVNQTKPSNGASTDVVRQLEQRASLPAAKHIRPQTANEQAFIKELVQKYGDDYDKMARDIKLNYMQRSAGDLKKRIKKWRAAGGEAG